MKFLMYTISMKCIHLIIMNFYVINLDHLKVVLIIYQNHHTKIFKE